MILAHVLRGKRAGIFLELRFSRLFLECFLYPEFFAKIWSMNIDPSDDYTFCYSQEYQNGCK
jgi:hypothetical protein